MVLWGIEQTETLMDTHTGEGGGRARGVGEDCPGARELETAQESGLPESPHLLLCLPRWAPFLCSAGHTLQPPFLQLPCRLPRTRIGILDFVSPGPGRRLAWAQAVTRRNVTIWLAARPLTMPPRLQPLHSEGSRPRGRAVRRASFGSLWLLFPLREQHRRQRHCPLAEGHGVRSWVPGPWFLFRVDPGWDRAVAARVPRAHAPYLWLDVTACQGADGKPRWAPACADGPVQHPRPHLATQVSLSQVAVWSQAERFACLATAWRWGASSDVGGLPGGLALPSHLPGTCDRRRLRRLLLPGLVLSRGSEAPV
ncbi:uncharacterized protein LOC112480536 [Pteropus alecto]|uniref:uncharacterized protein LOC112480536 n=1 Tax=Pteropus alecto TaxID=9402 RepID=UPI000D53B3F0|nr:uncharacterized protein LOC112480536 [Pteropus alecto]XP_024903341.1 uncharacterized protein LOC112480536 [Pteropus alecto]XP_024903342.1 uncharacterized protein LOC112480536 [Pteropus alecto]XP_024903343.1 uncharacterized protein LOC112480536 [Pteropus alecto]XP_024903344.1 uncharacterized protein LOC112480536 [Pteropus alecto]